MSSVGTEAQRRALALTDIELDAACEKLRQNGTLHPVTVSFLRYTLGDLLDLCRIECNSFVLYALYQVYYHKAPIPYIHGGSRSVSLLVEGLTQWVEKGVCYGHTK